ncbi:Mbeg1-like protein [Lacticaseibacillus baoqingensis]|uniref:Mbeg1-like protein n=1 Tax=Lacticaseibacillus baoqingensis TaxID=2486013 RepID=A0ABW4E986_9LACO|nr:Mbeg1-like protein [Lacticaseibacillus baoqingensis]
MANLLDYLAQYGDRPFSSRPLTIVDAAILAQLAYCPLHGSGQLASLSPQQQTALAAGTWAQADNRRLLAQVTTCRRYRQVAWLAPVALNDPAQEQAFSAITWQLAPELYYLSFRGTRATFVDWKEDFNMTFLTAIPSQTAASRYFTDIAAAYPGEYYLGGHSKGGTLATYAAVHAKAALQPKIRMAYNFDGPGLQQPLPMNGHYLKLVPQNSLIGMILDPTQDFGVVASQASGIRQHDLFTWQTHQTDFVYLSATDRSSQQLQKMLANWLASLDDATKQQALNAAYAVITATQKESFAELRRTPLTTTKALLTGLRQTQAADHAAWRAVLNALLHALITTAWRRQVPRETSPHH